SPAVSEVLLAASFTSFAPMFSYGSSSSISSATVTPSLVTVGPPQPLSRTALRPRGPSVETTAFASLETPRSTDSRASFSNTSCLTIAASGWNLDAYAGWRVAAGARLPSAWTGRARWAGGDAAGTALARRLSNERAAQANQVPIRDGRQPHRARARISWLAPWLIRR